MKEVVHSIAVVKTCKNIAIVLIKKDKEKNDS